MTRASKARRGLRAVGLSLAILALIGLAITAVILKITWDSWRTVRHAHSYSH